MSIEGHARRVNEKKMGDGQIRAAVRARVEHRVSRILAERQASPVCGCIILREIIILPAVDGRTRRFPLFQYLNNSRKG